MRARLGARGRVPVAGLALALAGLLALGVQAVPAAASASAQAARVDAGTGVQTPMWATQLDFDDNGTPWSAASFAALRADGLTTAEIDLPWNTLEPSPGRYDFTELDQELANAARAGIKLVPIFWQAGWGGSPAAWATSREVRADGVQGGQPAWWDPTEQPEYLAYVTDTVRHLAHRAGYGGSILNYGQLDAQWDVDGGAGGWAPADVDAFHSRYLPQAYGTVAAFDQAEGTAYTSFDQVPAAAAGQPLADVYQAFRAWSVKDTYGRMTAAARRVAGNTPLYYYFGGHLANAPAYANNPDTFFQLARAYRVTVIVDAAQSPGLTLTFGSLARAYGVKLAQEWTAPGDDSQLAAQAVQWLSNYQMGLPEGGGEDFFIHDGTTKDTVGWPLYTGWVRTLRGLSGSYPQQPVAVYVDYGQGYGGGGGGSLNSVEDAITSLWQNDPSGFTVVTSQEVAAGAVKLSDFTAVLPMNGVDADLTAYQQAGGTLLTREGQLAQYAPAYAKLANAGVVQVVPSVAAGRRSAELTLADVTSGTGYAEPVQVSPEGLGLRAGSYHVVDVTGRGVPAQSVQSDGSVCAAASLGAASLDEWKVVPGPVPAGTAGSDCPASALGATTVSATAGQPGAGLSFLAVGQTNAGSDANLSEVTEDGVPALATWTTAQSGAPGAYAYLQVNPFSAVASASTVTLDVTYWAAAGQGFRVQYDAVGNAYAGGPSVSSPGTGGWTTAEVTLTDAQFSQAENAGADLRLEVADATQPLVIRSVSLSVAG